MTRASKSVVKNTFDIWVATDASPHINDGYLRTWFYFSVTGVPSGEMLTFTFKNLSNQVSNIIHKSIFSYRYFLFSKNFTIKDSDQFMEYNNYYNRDEKSSFIGYSIK